MFRKFKKIIVPLVCLVVIGVSLTFSTVIAAYADCSKIGGDCMLQNICRTSYDQEVVNGIDCGANNVCCRAKTVTAPPANGPVTPSPANDAVVAPRAPSQAVSLDNPLGITDPSVLVGRIIFAILGLTGAIALVMFIWGGLQWMTAAGNAEKVTKGRDTLLWAVLGLVIIFSSYAILKAVLNIL